METQCSFYFFLKGDIKMTKDTFYKGCKAVTILAVQVGVNSIVKSAVEANTSKDLKVGKKIVIGAATIALSSYIATKITKHTEETLDSYKERLELAMAMVKEKMNEMEEEPSDTKKPGLRVVDYSSGPYVNDIKGATDDDKKQ